MVRKILAYLSLAVLIFLSGYNLGHESVKEKELPAEESSVAVETENGTARQNNVVTETEDGVTRQSGVLFEDIMGYDGYYDQETSDYGFSMRCYYGVTDDGKCLCLGQSFRIGEIEDYVYDIDGDGITELLCNTVTGASTHRELYVYKWSEDGILKGRVTWKEEDLPGLLYWGSNAVQTWYEPYAGDVRIHYSTEEEDVSIVKRFDFSIMEYDNVGFILLEPADAHGTYRDELE